MIKVLELKGFRSLRALNAFHTLMLGMKMLPMYLGETYDVFYERFKELPDSEKELMIRQAVLFVELKQEEVDALLSFCTDANGVPFEACNLKNLSPDQLVESIVAVGMEFGKMKIDILTKEEKKK